MANEIPDAISREAAEFYEATLVPALLAGWAARVAGAAALRPPQRVLDVGCGTGVLAREAAARVAPGGSVTGLDPNEAMLTVARAKATGIEWRQGRAEALPFADASFDAVVSQFALMFFGNRASAVAGMARVLRPGGRLAVAVWDDLARFPAYTVLLEKLERLCGREAAAALSAPFAMGYPGRLSSLFEGRGLRDLRFESLEGPARFASIGAWVAAEVRGWVLADVLSDADVERLTRECESALGEFVEADGSVAFRESALLVTAAKP